MQEPVAATVSSENTLGEPLYRFPATVAQQAFWYLDRLERGNPAWNIAVRFEIMGALQPPLLETAINKLADRHEALRTTFVFGDDEPEQIVHASASVPLPVEDLSSLPLHRLQVEEERLTVEEAERRFSLEAGPLFRARLLRFSPNRHMLLLTVHHIIADGWSIGIISDEIAAHYAAQTPVPELSLQFADYALWHRERCAPSNVKGDLDYWKQQLADLPVCEVPADYPRPATKSHNGYILSTLLPKHLTDALESYAHQQGCTLFTVALAALKLLVHHATGQNDIYIGTLLAGRDRVEFERLIGVFVNTIVLRSRIQPSLPFTDLLREVAQTVELGMAHSELPFAQLVGSLRLKYDRSRHALYGINFIYQRDFVKPLEFAGLTMVPVPSKSPGAIYDLNFFMVRRADGWRLSCEYDRELYSAASVHRMLGQLRHLFEQIVEDPDRALSSFIFTSPLADKLPPGIPGRTQATASLEN